MKNFLLFSLLLIGMSMSSCAILEVLAEPTTETTPTPSETPSTPATTKKTNKVVLKPGEKATTTDSRETKVIRKPTTTRPGSTKGSDKAGKVIEKPTAKPNNPTSQTMTKPKANGTTVAGNQKVIRATPTKKVVKATPAVNNKKVIRATPTKKVVKATPSSKTKVIRATPAQKVVKATPAVNNKKVIRATPAKKVVKATPAKNKQKVIKASAQITLDEPMYDFGTIKEGTIIKRDFKFTNTGGQDLIIEIATGSCGCTVPEWPIKAIKPGQSEVIQVTFDSTDKEYDTRVEVNIVANTQPIVTEIIMTGKVIPKRDLKKQKQG